MSDLFEDAPASGPGNAPELSVSEISGAIRKVLEEGFSHVRVRGEVGRVTHARSGHLYFDLKDDKSVLSAVSWRGQAARLSIQPEEGMEVVATGRVTSFAGQSRYQLIVEEVEAAGEGALMAMLEKRRKALAAEGLFDAARKKQLPRLPEVIGVVTSPTGAVIRDILHRLRDRFPRKVLIWPVAVQGRECAPQVARAIAGFNALTPGGALPRPDLLIVARGGGSVEDLWGFNEEIVVRAAAASEIPLISAVGHETDTTLIDHAADVRAPTPTAAAELAVPVRAELMNWIAEQDLRLKRGLQVSVSARRQRLSDVSRAMPRSEMLLEGPRQRLDRAAERLPTALRQSTLVRRNVLSQRAAALRPALLRRMAERARADLDRAAPLLAQSLARRLNEAQTALRAVSRMHETLSYRATLARGYAVVRDGETVISSASAARAAQALDIEFSDGHVPVGPGTAASRRPRRTGDDSDQGSLL